MSSKQETHSLENGFRHYPLRIVQVFKITHLTRYLGKYIQEIDTDQYRKEFTSEQWIKSLFLMQIHKFEAVRLFVRQLEQNNSWQAIYGYQGNQILFDAKLEHPIKHETNPLSYLYPPPVP